MSANLLSRRADRWQYGTKELDHPVSHGPGGDHSTPFPESEQEPDTMNGEFPYGLYILAIAEVSLYSLCALAVVAYCVRAKSPKLLHRYLPVSPLLVVYSLYLIFPTEFSPDAARRLHLCIVLSCGHIIVSMMLIDRKVLTWALGFAGGSRPTIPRIKASDLVVILVPAVIIFAVMWLGLHSVVSALPADCP